MNRNICERRCALVVPHPSCAASEVRSLSVVHGSVHVGCVSPQDPQAVLGFAPRAGERQPKGPVALQLQHPNAWQNLDVQPSTLPPLQVFAAQAAWVRIAFKSQ